MIGAVCRPVNNVIFYHKSKTQCPAVLIQIHIAFLIDFLHLIELIGSAARDHIFYAENIIDQFGKSIITVFIRSRLNTEAFAHINRSCRHCRGKQNHAVRSEKHILVTHTVAVNLASIEMILISLSAFLSFGCFFIGDLFIQIGTSSHSSVAEYTKDRITYHFHRCQEKEKRAEDLPVHFPKAIDQHRHTIEDQKSDGDAIRIQFPFAKSGHCRIDGKRKRCCHRQKNLPYLKLMHMPPGIKCHREHQENIDKCKTVRQSVLYMETMPDIVEHIDIKAYIEQHKQCRLCDPFTQLDIFIQQIQNSQDQRHRSAECIDTDLVVRNVDRFAECKLARQLR